MKIATINRDICIGCGMCTAIADAVFELADDGLAQVKLPNGELLTDEDIENAEQAADSCPCGAITIEDK